MPPLRLSVGWLCLLFALSVNPGNAAYQPPLRNPPPVRNPFLESLIRQAAAAVFLGDVETLQSLALKARAYEDNNAAELDGFRISDNLAELAAGLAPARNERLEQMAMAATEADDTVRAREAQARRDDPLVEARRLEWRRHWNRVAGVANYISESTASLAEGNFQVLLKWVADLLFCWRPATGLSAWERKQRILYQQFLERYPDDPQAPQVRAALERLDRKFRAETARDLLLLSELHREAGHPDEALFYARKAAEAGAPDAAAELSATQARMQPARDRAKTLAIGAGGESQAAPGEAADLQKLLRLLVAGEAENLAREADTILHAHPQSPFRGEAQYLLAVAKTWRETRGAPPLPPAENLAPGEDEDNMSVHARNVAASPFANPEAAYRMAQAQVDRDTWRYILFGVSPPAESLRQANQGEYQSRGVFDYISVVLVIDSLIRGIKTAFGAGPPNEPLRDAVGAWIRADPQGPRAKELAQWLGAQSERRGDYSKSLAYYEQSGAATESKRAELRQEEARDLYARAEQVEDPARRQAILEQASRELADTKYGQEAEKKAREAEKQQRLVLDKRSLAQTPGLWDGRGLRWPGALFDGRPENEELADAGATFFPPDHRDVQFTVIENGRQVVRRIRLEGLAHAEVEAALKERVQLNSRIEAADEYQRRRFVPLEIQGSAGAAGILVYPTLLPYRMNPEEERLYR